MGRSFFAFLVRSQEDLKAVRELEQKHNTLANDAKETDSVGEDFDPEMEYLLYFQEEYFLILGNHGGGSLTTGWLSKNKQAEMVIVYPFDKPKGWMECQNVYNGRTMRELLEKLPEKTPETECKFKVKEPPSRTPYDEISDFLTSQGHSISEKC